MEKAILSQVPVNVEVWKGDEEIQEKCLNIIEIKVENEIQDDDNQDNTKETGSITNGKQDDRYADSTEPEKNIDDEEECVNNRLLEVNNKLVENLPTSDDDAYLDASDEQSNLKNTNNALTDDPPPSNDEIPDVLGNNEPLNGTLNNETCSSSDTESIKDKDEDCNNLESEEVSKGEENTLSDNCNKDSSSVEEEVKENCDNIEDNSINEESLKDKEASFIENRLKMNEKMEALQQELSELKLKLNGSQQEYANLVLEVSKKEEIFIKSQAEALKNEQALKQEIKQLKEKLKETPGTKELEEALKEAKAREAKAVNELNARVKDESNFQKIMEEYEKSIGGKVADYQKLKEEHELVNRHLANLELAFSDVHTKYERAKTIIEGFKNNEAILKQNLALSDETIKQHEERYESLKSHAQSQIEKSNKEILQMREKHSTEVNMLKTVIKRLEVKASSLSASLEQKNQEIAALTSICDEFTGKVLDK